MPLPNRRVITVVGATAWIAAVAGGFFALEHHAAAAGTARAPAADVALAFADHRLPGRALAVMAVHPKCPCTSASFAEFGDFLARAGDRCDGLIVQIAPSASTGGGPDWQPAAPTRSLGGRSVPVVADADGRLAAVLGAETSGHIVLIDAGGAVRFCGGITLSRGHRGRSPAQDAMLAALSSSTAGDGAPVELCGASMYAAPVYGCPLQEPCAPTPATPEAQP